EPHQRSHGRGQRRGGDQGSQGPQEGSDPDEREEEARGSEGPEAAAAAVGEAMSLIKDREDTMSSTTLAARVRGLSRVGGDTSKRGLGVRVIITVLLAALIVPALMMAFSSAAFADEEDRENYSMYNLASNASTYFSEKNSPSTDDKATFLENWGQVMKNPANGG